MSLHATEERRASRSTFVSVLAWVVIVLSGLATLRGLMANILIATTYPPGRLDAAERSQGLSPPPSFMESHIRLVYGAYLLAWAVILVVSIFLLRRKSWARVAAMCLALLAILSNLGALVSNLPLLSQLVHQTTDFPGASGGLMLAYGTILNIGSTAVLGWIIKRLHSEAVRREFDNS